MENEKHPVFFFEDAYNWNLSKDGSEVTMILSHKILWRKKNDVEIMNDIISLACLH